MAEPTHRVFFGPTGQHMAEVLMGPEDLDLAFALMCGGNGVLVVAGETVLYRIAGRSITAVVEIPAKLPDEEKPVVRVRLDLTKRPPKVEALAPEHSEIADRLDFTFANYVRAGLTTTEAVERLCGLDTMFTLEFVNNDFG